MKTHIARILVICADAVLAEELTVRLEERWPGADVSVAGGALQAGARMRRQAPTVIVFDQSAADGRPLDTAAGELASVAPVVLLADRDRRVEVARLDGLVGEREIDVVWRVGDFLALAETAVERRLETAAGEVQDLEDWLGLEGAPENFGEILRHEMNNPLTGILGNAELLLARRDALPAAAVQRLETIAQLAVRLRETIRRLSNAWDSRTHARSV